jgi:hypothetical protein
MGVSTSSSPGWTNLGHSRALLSNAFDPNVSEVSSTGFAVVQTVLRLTGQEHFTPGWPTASAAALGDATIAIASGR